MQNQFCHSFIIFTRNHPLDHCESYQQYQQNMSTILSQQTNLSTQSLPPAQQLPPHQRQPQFPIWQPPSSNPIPQSISHPSRYQPPTSPNLNVQDLNQDLLKLKEQLKKLAERGEEMGANRARAQEALSARVRIQSCHQVPPQIRTNTSTDLLHQHRRKQASSQLIFYPSTATNPNTKIVSELPKSTADPSPPSKRDKIQSFMHNREDRGKIIPLINPNKRQFYNKLNIKPQQPQRIELEKEIKELKEKLTKLQSELQKSQQQKQSLALQIKSLLKANEQLREVISNKGRQIKSKSMILQPTISVAQFEQKQKRASIIIQKLNSQIMQLKNGDTHSRVSFDEVLKSQLEENKLLKVRLDEKGEEIQQMNDLLNNERINNESLRNELALLQLKANTQLRVKQSKLQVQLSDKSNELQTAKRALQTLELKYRTAVHQIKEKDHFIMSYLVGRSKDNQKEEIMTILQKYTIAFPQNRTIENLLKEQREIDALREEVKRLTQQSK